MVQSCCIRIALDLALRRRSILPSGGRDRPRDHLMGCWRLGCRADDSLDFDAVEILEEGLTSLLPRPKPLMTGPERRMGYGGSGPASGPATGSRGPSGRILSRV
jgi:hypothetical protein